MGESKYKILQKIAGRFLPRMHYYREVPTGESLIADLSATGISFPFIVKPDVGQGGWLVEMISDQDDLHAFLSRIKMPFIVQEYISAPLELGVLYYRHPNENRGRISSLAVKQLLSVTGDGTSSIRQLLERHPRAQRALHKMSFGKRINLHQIPETGKAVTVSYIANHSYGTRFLNGNDRIDGDITAVFDTLSKQIDGFYFGRFDIRCDRLEDLKTGNFKILELNGVGSEPLHIFDPAETLRNAYISSFAHWKAIYHISMSNRQAGTSYMTFRQAWNIYKSVRHIQRLHRTAITIGN